MVKPENLKIVTVSFIILSFLPANGRTPIQNLKESNRFSKN